MALQCNYNFKGIQVPNAYVRIDRVSGCKREGSITPQMPGQALWLANVEIFTQDKTTPITYGVFTLPLEEFNINIFEHFYAHLKTLPEFAGAVDC